MPFFDDILGIYYITLFMFFSWYCCLSFSVVSGKLFFVILHLCVHLCTGCLCLRLIIPLGVHSYSNQWTIWYVIHQVICSFYSPSPSSPFFFKQDLSLAWNLQNRLTCLAENFCGPLVSVFSMLGLLACNIILVLVLIVFAVGCCLKHDFLRSLLGLPTYIARFLIMVTIPVIKKIMTKATCGVKHLFGLYFQIIVHH